MTIREGLLVSISRVAFPGLNYGAAGDVPVGQIKTLAYTERTMKAQHRTPGLQRLRLRTRLDQRGKVERRPSSSTSMETGSMSVQWRAQD